MTEPFGYGFLYPNDELGGLNPSAFVVSQMLARLRTMTLCVVNSIGLPGLINVQPLVSMADGQGNAGAHGTIYGVPYLQVRSGTSAIIAVPAVGDVGLLAICDRDISAAKASLAPGPPPSGREFDFSDAVYILGLGLGPAATQTVTVDAAGITFADANGNSIAMTSSGIALTSSSPIVVNGTMHVTGNVIGGFGGADQVGLQTHEHPTAAAGSPSPPTPGT